MHEIFHIVAHAGNCHGEITMLAPMVMSFLDGLPFVGTWISSLVTRLPGWGCRSDEQ